MNELLNKINIENMIYEIRGKQVMLDRFLTDFCFQLTDAEMEILRSQIVTSNLTEHGGRRYNNYVFTEQGVAMLATILRTSVASEVSIKIMRAFVSMRKYLYSNLLESKHITNLVLKHENLITEHENKIEDKEVLNLILNRL